MGQLNIYPSIPNLRMGLEPSILFDREGSGFLGATCGDFFLTIEVGREGNIIDKEVYLLDSINENVCRPFTHP